MTTNPRSTFSFFVNAMTLLDRYGTSVGLELNYKMSHKNFLGALITILTIGASLYLTSEIFSDFLNFRKPTVWGSTEYDLKSIDFNFSNFYFAVSFYDPVKSDTVGAGIKPNNYTSMKYINQLNITCTTCKNDFQTTQMLLCAEDQFKTTSLKSMSDIKSSSIVDIFKTYSFCFPEKINGTIKDLNATESAKSNQDTSVSVFIPISSVSIDELNIGRNSYSIPDASNPTSTVVNTPTVAPVVVPAAPAAPTQPTTTPTTPTPTNNPNQLPGAQSGTQGPPGQPAATGGQTGTGTGTLPTGLPTNPTQGQTFPGPPAGGPTSGGTTGGATQPTGPQTQPTGPQSQPTTGQTGGAAMPGGQQGGPAPPGRVRQLQTSGLPSSSNIAAQEINSQMKAILDKFKFPKMMVINRSFQLNPGSDANDVLKYIYNLEVLDYRDQLSGNPIVYDIYVQKKKIIVTRPNKFSTETITTEFLTIQRIEKNSFDSLQNNGAYFSFKLYSDVEIINLKYILLSDVLSTFGSFFTTFTLVGSILASFYTDSVLESTIINTVFKFVKNDPKNFHRLEMDVRQTLYEDRRRKTAEQELLIEKENEDRSKKYRIEREVNDKHEEEKNTSKEKIKDYIPTEREEVDKPAIFIEKNIDGTQIEMNEINLHEKSLSEHKSSKKIIPVSKIEKETLKSKIKMLQKMEDKKYCEEKLSLPELYELNQLKKRKRILKPLSHWDFFCVNFGLSRCYNRKHVEAWKAVSKIVRSNLQTETLIRRNLDVEEFKKLFLNKKQQMIFKYYLKHINYDNIDNSVEYLNHYVNQGLQPKKEDLEKDEFDFFKGKIDLRLYDNFKSTYNF
jgi:hypothetical protein